MCDICDGQVYYGQGPYYPFTCSCAVMHDICDPCRMRYGFPGRGPRVRLPMCTDTDEFQTMLELQGVGR